MAYTAKDPCPPLLYLTETKSWKWEGEEEEGGGEKVSLKSHATARGVVKKGLNLDIAQIRGTPSLPLENPNSKRTLFSPTFKNI